MKHLKLLWCSSHQSSKTKVIVFPRCPSLRLGTSRAAHLSIQERPTVPGPRSPAPRISYNPGLPRCEVISLWPLPVRNQEGNLRRNLIPVHHDALLWHVPMPSEVVSRCCPPPGLQGGWVRIGNNGNVRYLVLTYWAEPEFEHALCNTAQPLGSFLDPSPAAAWGLWLCFHPWGRDVPAPPGTPHRGTAISQHYPEEAKPRNCLSQHQTPVSV